MKEPKKKYQVWTFKDDEPGSREKGWVTCKKADPQPSGWLHYELSDGTNGLAMPERWREKP